MNRLCACLCTAIALVAGPAAALTCVGPSIQRAFAAAQAASDVYVPVIGRFSGFAQRSPDQSSHGTTLTYTADFTGRIVTAKGFGRSLAVPVSVTELCIGPYCPAFAPDSQVMTFLRRDGAGYAFQIDACSGNTFSDPGPKQLGILRDCLADKVCPDN